MALLELEEVLWKILPWNKCESLAKGKHCWAAAHALRSPTPALGQLLLGFFLQVENVVSRSFEN